MRNNTIAVTSPAGLPLPMRVEAAGSTMPSTLDHSGATTASKSRVRSVLSNSNGTTTQRTTETTRQALPLVRRGPVPSRLARRRRSLPCQPTLRQVTRITTRALREAASRRRQTIIAGRAEQKALEVQHRLPPRQVAACHRRTLRESKRLGESAGSALTAVSGSNTIALAI